MFKQRGFILTVDSTRMSIQSLPNSILLFYIKLDFLAPLKVPIKVRHKD